MLRVPAISERSGRFLIGVLLCIKLLLLVWNAYAYDGRTYHAEHHADRAVFAGLQPGRLHYDPPLYYLPLALASRPDGVPQIQRQAAQEDEGAPRRARPSKAEQRYRGGLLDLLRYSNVLWIAVFYLAWVGYAFPRLLGWGQRWFLASLLLLTLPGFQKVAAMSHPENALAATSALAVCGWLWLRQRWAAPGSSESSAQPRVVHGSDLRLAAVAVMIGMVGMTRPTAIVPVLILTIVAVVYAVRFAGHSLKRALPRAALIVLVVAGLSGSWHYVRWQQSGTLTAFMPDEVAAEAEARRPGFSYASYFGSFHARALWETPNTTLGGEEVTGRGVPRADSFFTLLYSEVWGDHWLSFSGARYKERKAWPKRILLGSALLLPSLLGLLAVFGVHHFVRRARSSWRETPGSPWTRLVQLAKELEAELVLLAWFALGAALFVCWQAGPALLPGDQSSVKFIHVAALVPPLLALLFTRPLKPSTATLLAAYLLVLYCAAFPVAMYWPS